MFNLSLLITVLGDIKKFFLLIMGYSLIKGISFTTNALAFIIVPSIINFVRVDFGMTFIEESILTKTLARTLASHFMDICSALLWV